MKKLSLIFIAFSLLLGITQIGKPNSISAETSSFSDIDSYAEHEDKIYYLVDKGVIAGFHDGTFRPNAEVTRGQFAAFVARALELQESTKTFIDVPESSALYKEINQAATAGVINGYINGTFKPHQAVSRSDIAAMLDRALQMKGSFTKTTDLTYYDKDSIGTYALDSVKRLTAYGIMGSTGWKNNLFEPSKAGTRIDTVISIYKMLELVNLNEEETDTDNDTDTVTYQELIETYGSHELLTRHRATQEIFKTDIVKNYYEYVNDNSKFDNPNLMSFPEYLEDTKAIMNSEYSLFYPSFEVISYNNQAFRDAFYNEKRKIFEEYDYFNVWPTNPKTNGHFLVDIKTNATDFAIYLKDKVDIGRMAVKPYKKNGLYMVDANEVFKTLATVKSTSDSITINDLTLTVDSDLARINDIHKPLPVSVEVKNGKIMVPVQAVSDLLGFYTRAYSELAYPFTQEVQRIDIANYPLDSDYPSNN